jgi:hypothetical protein
MKSCSFVAVAMPPDDDQQFPKHPKTKPLFIPVRLHGLYCYLYILLWNSEETPSLIEAFNKAAPIAFIESLHLCYAHLSNKLSVAGTPSVHIRHSTL